MQLTSELGVQKSRHLAPTSHKKTVSVEELAPRRQTDHSSAAVPISIRHADFFFHHHRQKCRTARGEKGMSHARCGEQTKEN